MAKKMTKKEMFAQLLALDGLTAEQKEFIQHEIELLEREKKKTPAQEANEVLKLAILNYLKDTGKEMTISEMVKEIPQCEGLSTSKVSAMVTQLKNAYYVTRKEIKGTAYFSA